LSALLNAATSGPVSHRITRILLRRTHRPVGIGALVTVDTSVAVDVNAVAAAVRDCYDRMINLR
jgi:hypothetical protein